MNKPWTKAVKRLEGGALEVIGWIKAAKDADSPNGAKYCLIDLQRDLEIMLRDTKEAVAHLQILENEE